MKNYIAGGMIVSALLIFLGLENDSSSSHPNQTGSAEFSSTSGRVTNSAYDEKVNKHLFQTQAQKDLKAAKAKAENTMMAPDLHEVEAQTKYGSRNSGVQTHGDVWDDQIVEQFEKTYQQETYKPDFQVQQDLYENQMMNQYDQAYREEYKKQFIENARRAGYQVKLGPDNKVMSVKPLKKPASIQDFPVTESNQGAVR